MSYSTSEAFAILEDPRVPFGSKFYQICGANNTRELTKDQRFTGMDECIIHMSSGGSYPPEVHVMFTSKSRWIPDTELEKTIEEFGLLNHSYSIQLVRQGNTMQDRQVLSEFIDELKDLAERYDIAIITARQLPREDVSND